MSQTKRLERDLEVSNRPQVAQSTRMLTEISSIANRNKARVCGVARLSWLGILSASTAIIRKLTIERWAALSCSTNAQALCHLDLQTYCLVNSHQQTLLIGSITMAQRLV